MLLFTHVMSFKTHTHEYKKKNLKNIDAAFYHITMVHRGLVCQDLKNIKN